MGTILEELLIKIGVEIDPSGLKAINSIQKMVGKSAMAASKRLNASTKSLKGNADFLRRHGIQKRNETKEAKESNAQDKKSNESLTEKVGLLKKFAAIGAVGLAAKKFNDYSNSMARVGAETAKTSRDLGISSEALQELQFAMTEEGGTAEEMTSILSGLNDAIGEAFMGRGPQEGLSLLGITVAKTNGELKTSVELLEELVSATEHLSPQLRRQRLGLFGATGLSRISGGGRGKLEAARERKRGIGFEDQGTTTSAEQLADAQQQAADAWRESTETTRALWTDIKKTLYTTATKELIQESERGKASRVKGFIKGSAQGYVPSLGLGGTQIRPTRKAAASETTLNATITVNANTTDEKLIGDVVEKKFRGVAQDVIANKDGGTQ